MQKIEVKIPLYVQDFFRRSTKELDFVDPVIRAYKNNICKKDLVIKVDKAGFQTKAETFRKECERVNRWINRTWPNGSYIIYTPKFTKHKYMQYGYLVVSPMFQELLKDYINTPEQWQKRHSKGIYW